MATYVHQISLLVRMHLTATGHPVASVPFSHRNKQFELLLGEDARLARRRVAGQTLPEMLTTLRAKLPTSSEHWELLETSLSAAGLYACPTSGTPVLDLQQCSDSLKDALWAVLAAMAVAVNSKKTADLDASMSKLSELLKQHALTAPRSKKCAQKRARKRS